MKLDIATDQMANFPLKIFEMQFSPMFFKILTLGSIVNPVKSDLTDKTPSTILLLDFLLDFASFASPSGRSWSLLKYETDLRIGGTIPISEGAKISASFLGIFPARFPSEMTEAEMLRPIF